MQTSAIDMSGVAALQALLLVWCCSVVLRKGLALSDDVVTGSTGPAMLTKQAQRAIETTSVNAFQNVLGCGVAGGSGL